MIDQDSGFYGRRDRETDRRRGLALATLLLILILLELAVGQDFEWQQAGSVLLANRNIAMTYFAVPDAYKSVPSSSKYRKRLLYISNSHAKTGGQVPVHLQRLLDRLAPGEFEVLDLADPGIFAPDMLQRTLTGLDLELEAIIMGVSYICFSDRMGLAQQAHSVRSFFKDGILDKLSTGFWLRNYDIGLYGDTLMAHHVRLYRYRNQIRDTWERPIASLFKDLTGTRQILFLEADVNKSWKFPQGYDRNLFQWNLYATGREGHLADLREAIIASRGAGVPVFAFNMPIHWEKSVYPHDSDDVKRYRSELHNIFRDVIEYVDYQDSFPKRFTTYDALHPTWHGARLHALDISLRLAKHGFFRKQLSPERIVKEYLYMYPALSEEYVNSLSGSYSPLTRASFRRYDITEPENARNLMRRLVSLPAGSSQEQRFLYDLSLRLRYWLEGQFTAEENDKNDRFSRAFDHAVRHEVSKARERMGIFWKELVENQTRRLSVVPVPELKEATLVQRYVNQIDQNVTLVSSHYRLSDGSTVIKVTTEDGRTVAYGLSNPSKKLEYQRTDILGDESFLMLQPLGDQILLPSWLLHSSPLVQLGI